MDLECLLPYSQPLDKTSISLEVAFSEVVQQPSSLTYKLEKSAAGMVILNMDLEVIREMVDALAQQCYLHLRGTRIGPVELELLNHFALLLLSNPHVSSVHPFPLFCSVGFFSTP